MTFQFTRFDGPLGAEITGLDLAATLDDATLAAIRRAFLDSGGVLVLRDQHITPARQVAFSRKLGPLQIHVLKQYHHPGHPEILTVSNVVEDGRPIGLGDAGRFWHSDLSYVEEPSLGSLLHAQELPETGGDTLFASMHRAYDALAPALQARIDTLQAVHSYLHSYDRFTGSSFRPPLTGAQKASVREVVHPVVRLHPETGRKALFVNDAFTARILDLPDADSHSLLAELCAHSIRPDFVYRHRWRPHDLLFWDNRSVIHRAEPCEAPLRRTLYRTTVAGDRPVGPAAA